VQVDPNHDPTFVQPLLAAMGPAVNRYRVYGVGLETEFPFTWPVPGTSGPVDLRFDLEDAPPGTGDAEEGGATRTATIDVPDVRAGARDEEVITYHRRAGLDIVRIRDTAEHYLYSDRILCHLHRSEWAFLAEIQLLGIVLALWLERRGRAVLHASAVVVGGGAVAFLGAKGGGKTTAATALVAAGHPLLVDDLLALEVTDGPTFAQAGYPMLRLEPDQVHHFVGDHRSLPIVHPDFTKRRVFLEDGLGAFHPGPAPLRQLYIPLRGRDRAAPVMIEPLTDRDGLLAGLHHSYLRDLPAEMGLAPDRLRLLARVLERVPVSIIRYPDGFENLPALVDAVERDVARG
jgi:hypothetical protein